MQNMPGTDLDRRKHVRLRVRPDLSITPQKYEGRTYFVVKDPVSLRYYRFKEQEHFLLGLMDGRHTLDEAQKAFERRFRPERLTLEDLEHFGQQLLSAGLVQNESPAAGKVLFDNRKKRRRMEMLQTFTNILYIKIPVFDPERILTVMLPPLRWIFTYLFLFASILFMASAVGLVLTHFDTFRSRLPSYHEFFSFKTVIYLWAALGVVKVIHEFGHGLSCKAFGGEVHEMGFLLLCLSPAMYCNVSDAWTLPNKWHRIIISAAGIYVELMIAAAATFLWWYTPAYPFLNHMCLSLMVVCSVSTVVFNGNPLMRYDGYYVLADWLEIPNLRDRANRYLNNLAMEYCLGIEVPPEQYMETRRRVLFVIFAVVSYIYRWVITFTILIFLASFLKPYRLEILSELLALASLASLVGWPLYRLIRNVQKRGRLPDMKPVRVTLSAMALAVVLLAFFLVPLPVSRVRELGVVVPDPKGTIRVAVQVSGTLQKITVREGEYVQAGKVLALFENTQLETAKFSAITNVKAKEDVLRIYTNSLTKDITPQEKSTYLQKRDRALAEKAAAEQELKAINAKIDLLQLKAPISGVVMGLPKIDEIGKVWDIDQSSGPTGNGTLFCTIGDAKNLRILLPVTPSNFDLMKAEFARNGRKPLDCTIRIHGRGGTNWKGSIAWDDMPQSEAAYLPISLTQRGGGPLAIKPGANDPNKLEPQAQVFLVVVNLHQPDEAIAIGTIAQTKVHLEWRSGAWFVWHTLTSTFDVMLMARW